ncbi:MAG: caspase family protein [Hyphomicrobiaceae bacterium]
MIRCTVDISAFRTRLRWASRSVPCALGCLLALLLVVLPAAAETRHALVIGNGGYQTAPLRNPKNDAEAIAKALTATGFVVTTLIDADQKAMRRAVVDLGRRLRGADSVGVLYYAGHGVQLAGENYLIPVGADIRNESEVAVEGVNLAEILKTMGAAQSRINIVVLDACRNNPFAAGARAGGGGLAPVDAPAGTLIAFATAPGQVALDGEGANSPYSLALSKAIPAAGVVLEEVFRKTRREVLAVTGKRQTPWEHSSLTGAFFFKPKQAEPEASQRSVDLGGLADAQIAEIRAWERIRDSQDPAVLATHVASFPNGIFADVAKLRLEQQKKQRERGDTVAGWLGNIFGATGGDAESERMLEDGLKLEAKGTADADRDAFKLYRTAAGRGLPAAMHQLARAYDRGRGTERSLKDAAAWYQKAADLRHAPSQASLGTMYEFGEGVPVDLVRALRLYTLAADVGDANGLASLGYLYQQGKGVARDEAEARAWYAKAAKAGSTRAMYNLALMQIRGQGGTRNFAEAVALLDQAIAKGHVGAHRELAFLYDEGRGVTRDPRAAADNLLIAFKAGHRDARMDLLTRPEALSAATRREVQRKLSEKGLYSGRTNGYFDMRTRLAIERFARRAS